MLRSPAPQQARCRCLSRRVLGTVNMSRTADAVDHRPHMVNVSFKVEYKCAYGQSLLLVGNAAALGSWSTKRGQRMHWSRGDVWTCNVMLPAGSAVESKYVVLGDLGMEQRWQEGSNMLIEVPVIYQGLPVQRYDVGVSWCQKYANFKVQPLNAPVVATAAVVAGRMAQAALGAETAAAAVAATSPAAVTAVAASVTMQMARKGASATARFNPAAAAQSAVADAAAVSIHASQAAALTSVIADTATTAVVPPAAVPGPCRRSIVLPPRLRSPPLKINLSSNVSKLMDVPTMRPVGSSAATPSLVPAATSAAAAAASANAFRTATATTTTTTTTRLAHSNLQSHAMDLSLAPSSYSQTCFAGHKGMAPSYTATAAGETPAATTAAANAMPRSYSNSHSRPVTKAPGAPTSTLWGMEYDIYASAYGLPYMHTPFDLEAYGLDEQVCPEPSTSSVSLFTSSALGSTHGSLGLLSASPATGSDPLESAVQAALNSTSNSQNFSADFLGATAAGTGLASSASATTTAAATIINTTAAQPAGSAWMASPPASDAIVAGPLEVYRQISRSSMSVSDWAGRTLIEMSSGRSLIDEDSDEDEAADDEAAMIQALAAPASPADMTALLAQLGTALGRSVRLRYDGIDATAQDLLELDRKIALAASKLYRQHDGLLIGWQRKETRRQLAAAAVAPANRPPMPIPNTVTSV